MTEYEQAKNWRESLSLDRAQLGEHIGYSQESIYWFERGMTPARSYTNQQKHDRSIDPYVWRRYRMACAGLAAEITGHRFEWK